jgi:CubicO group peptidase (beta-lactamase class C family)
MSAPQQTVYFYTPTAVGNLNTAVANLQNDVGYGQQISTNVQKYLTTGAYQLQNRAPVYAGTGGLVPSNISNIATYIQGGHPGFYVVGGNYRTGEEYFAASDRPINSNSDVWNYTGTLYNFGSATKILSGVICAKMIEEGIIKASDPCYLYYPNMSGISQYYTNVTVNSGTAFPFADASYTATTGAFDLSTLTIKNLINYNIGLLNDFFVLPNAVSALSSSTSINPVITNSNSGANIVGLAQYLQFATLSKSLLNGNPVGPVSQVYNGTVPFVTTGALDGLINNTRTGVMPFAFKPGSWQNDLLPFNIRSQQSVYDAGFALLGIVLDGAIKKKTSYTCFADYARAKILTPLGMNDTYFVAQDTVTNPNKYKIADTSFRRSAGLGGANYLWSQTLPGYDAFTGTVNPFQGNEPTFVAAASAGSASALRLYGFVANSFGCSRSYSTGAVSQLNTIQNVCIATNNTGAAGALTVSSFVSGPLAWASQYPDDGISKVGKGVFYYLTGSPSNYPISAAPVLSTLSDFSKLLRMIGNKGKAPNGQRILKTESWAFVTSVKVSALAMQGDNQRIEEETYGNKNQDEFEFPNSGYCLGCYRTNRDITTNTVYGLDENTLFNGGATGNAWVVDLYTGNYYFYGTTEISLSSGVLPFAGGSRNTDAELGSEYVLLNLIRD